MLPETFPAENASLWVDTGPLAQIMMAGAARRGERGLLSRPGRASSSRPRAKGVT